jgi:hypothetical protein
MPQPGTWPDLGFGSNRQLAEAPTTGGRGNWPEAMPKTEGLLGAPLQISSRETTTMAHGENRLAEVVGRDAAEPIREARSPTAPAELCAFEPGQHQLEL